MESEKIKSIIKAIELEIEKGNKDIKDYESKMFFSKMAVERLTDDLKKFHKELREALKEEMPEEEILLKKLASIEQLLKQNQCTIERQKERIENSKINLEQSREKLRSKLEHRKKLLKDYEETGRQLSELGV